jgi:NAD kinase
MNAENAIIVVNKTRLEVLVERFNTLPQARFYIEHSGGNFEDYQSEHDHFKKSLENIVNGISKETKYKIIDRSFVPNFIFSAKDIIVVVGQDGLVANTAKYTDNLPLLGINPDTTRYDGILLPFDTTNFMNGYRNVLAGDYRFKTVTMAEACLNDKQRLLAFNDFFIGPSSHISARYSITYKGKSEKQSSSGIIISTGAGSTGWLSSVINMVNGIFGTFNPQGKAHLNLDMKWNDDKLVFVVREPFVSRHSSASITLGFIEGNSKLVIESQMPMNGKIFSDGIENDYLNFNSGAIVEIGKAKEKAKIVTL